MTLAVSKPITRSDIVTVDVKPSFVNTVVLLHLSHGITGSHLGGVSGFAAKYEDQAYFWTKEWQQDEAEVDYDYAVGNYYEPRDARDLIRWLRDG